MAKKGGLFLKRRSFRDFMDTTVAGASSILIVVLLYFLLLRLSSIVSAVTWLWKGVETFFIGAVLAYLLKGPCNFMDEQLAKIIPEKHKKIISPLSVVIVMLLTLLIIYGLIASVLPQTINSIATIVNSIPDAVTRLTRWVNNLHITNPIIQKYLTQAITSVSQSLDIWFSNDVMSYFTNLVGGLSSTVNAIIVLLKNVFIGLIVCVYILLGRKNFSRQGKAVLNAIFSPKISDKIMQELDFIDDIFIGFFGGKIIDSAIIGVVTYIFCLILSFTNGLQNSLLIALIVGVTNIIPYFGPFIGGVPTALMVLMDSKTNCIIFVIFIIILQQIDGNILGPRILSQSVGISGFWVLFSIMFFSYVFGFIGFLIGVPIFAVIYDLAKRLVARGLENHGRSYLLAGNAPPPETSSPEPDVNKEKNE